MKISTVNKYLNHKLIDKVISLSVVMVFVLYHAYSMIINHSTKNLIMGSTNILIATLVVYFVNNRIGHLSFIIPILLFIDFPIISLIFIVVIILIEPIETCLKYEKKNPAFKDFVRENKKVLLKSFTSFTIFCLASSFFIKWLIEYLLCLYVCKA